MWSAVGASLFRMNVDELHALVNMMQSIVATYLSCNHVTPPEYMEAGIFQ
jgi:hypothetical protein